MKRIKILLVDNDGKHLKLNREFLKRSLVSSSVIISKDITTALELLNRERFDVLIIKHSPPVLNSFPVLSRLEEINSSIIPIVLIKKSNKRLIEKLIHLHCTNYLPTTRNYYQQLPQLVLRCVEKTKALESKKALEKEHKNRIEHLEVCKRYFEDIVNATHFVIYTTDKDLKITGFNKSFRGFIKSNNLSNKVQSLIGAPILTLFKLDAEDDLKHNLNQLISNKKRYFYYEFSYTYRRNKSFYDMLVNPIKSGKQVTGLVFLTKDITERKIIENKIKESEQNYRTLFENIDELIFRSDDKGNILFINKSVEKLLEYSGKYLISKPSKLLKSIHPEDYEMIRSVFDKYDKGLKTSKSELECRLITKKNQTIYLGGTIYPRLNEDGKFIGFEGVAQDITEKKKAEIKEKTLQLELQNKSKLASIGKLAAGVAHEINNPLGALSGGIEVLKERYHNDSYLIDRLKKISKITERITKIVDGLLYLSRQKALKKEYTNINNMIDDSIETFKDSIREKSIKLRKKIKIVKNLTHSLPKIPVEKDQISQVFLNLLKNAYDAIEKSGTISISSLSSKDENNVLITFKDTGIGIPKKNLDKIFLPFFTTKDVDKGTGLGLSICDGIIKAHKGDILVESKPGVGSKITVRLPIML